MRVVVVLVETKIERGGKRRRRQREERRRRLAYLFVGGCLPKDPVEHKVIPLCVLDHVAERV